MALRPFRYRDVENVLGADLDIAGWERRREEIQQRALELLGAFPDQRPDLRPQLRLEEDLGTYRRCHVSFESEGGDRVTAYLLIPSAPRREPCPAVVVMHTSATSGKDSTVGRTGIRPEEPPDPDMAYALDVVEHGYVALALDADTAGERGVDGRISDTTLFYRRCPNWSAMGKVAWDISRAVDFLGTLDIVDHGRIACMGHCFGAYCSVFGAAFDPRIQAVLASSALWSFRSGRNAWARDPDDPEALRAAKMIWGQRAGVYTHIPKLAEYVGYGLDSLLRPLPLDYADLACLIPARLLAISVPSYDIPQTEPLASFSEEITSHTCSSLARLYRMYGHPERFAIWMTESGHTWTHESKQHALELLDVFFES